MRMVTDECTKLCTRKLDVLEDMLLERVMPVATGKKKNARGKKSLLAFFDFKKKPKKKCRFLVDKEK
jgi:hypothetical protein